MAGRKSAAGAKRDVRGGGGAKRNSRKGGEQGGPLTAGAGAGPILEAVRAVLEGPDFATTARRIFDGCRTLLGAPAGYVALLSDDGNENEVLFLESGGRECTVPPDLPMPIRGLRAVAYRERRAAFDNGFATSEWASLMPEGHVSLESVLFAPLLVDGEAVGLLGLANKPGGFTEEDARLADAFGALAAVALRASRASLAQGAAEARERAVLSAMSEALAVHEPLRDRDGAARDYRFVEVNPAFESQTGLRAAAVVGRTLGEAVPSVAETWAALLSEVDRTGSPARLDAAPGPGGRAFAASAFKIGPSRFGTLLVDVSDRVAGAERLRTSEERFRLVSEAARIAVYDLQPATGELRWAGGVSTIFGIEAGELDPQGLEGFARLVHPEDRGRVAAGRAEATSTFELAYRVARPDGAVVHVEERGGHVAGDGGRPSRTLGVLVDVSSRVAAEDERRRLEEQILHVQKLESLGVLAGGIAHDFNNLLMAILGNADLALTELSPASGARSYLLDIEAASRRAADLCRQMLAYAGKGRFVVEPVDVTRLVRDMTQMLLVSIPKKVVLRSGLAEGLPPVMADAAQLRQLVMNLVLNAAEAVGDRSGVVGLTTGAMECDRAYLSEVFLDEDLPEGTYVFLEVADTGCGMDEATRARLFDPFFTTKFAGRGLGLPAALGIVRGHRGAIKVYSEPGRGSTFKVLLPATTSEPSGVHVFAPFETEWAGGTVLVADDEEVVRVPARKMLERLGFEVILAADGAEAVELFRKHAEDVVLVLLDLSMPRMDGQQAFSELRRLRSDVRVLLSSGYNEQEAVQLFAGKGLAGFVQKPYDLATLMAAIERVLLLPDKG